MKQGAWIFIITILLFGSCDNKQSQMAEEENALEYAKEFSILRADNFDLLKIPEPWQGSRRAYTYLLHHQENFEVPDSLKGVIPIKVPVTSLVSNSTTHLPMLEVLKQEHVLKGFAQTQYISSQKFIDRLDSGQIQEMGHNAQVNLEVVLDLNPQLFLAFNTSGDNKHLAQIERSGIDLLYIADYKESSVLGRAEWIKVFGLLTDTQKESETYFDQLVVRYDSLKGLTPVERRPSVLSGTLYGGTWFAPNGENYNSHLIGDAGGNYIFKNESGDGWLNLDFEVVYSKGWDADFWIGVANFNTLEELESMDGRYANFEAFKNGKAYTYNKRVNDKDANDYFESGQLNPDRLLADHIKILHPEELPNYELYYYKKLD